MKYKVGDVVKLKSAEELMKLGTWCKECAEVCGGKSYKIEEFAKIVIGARTLHLVKKVLNV